MIPKKIHYFWFGGNPLPDFAKKCIESWKKNLPEYEIVEWNESNYDVHKIPYISQAYDAKKYAFVSDYARFDVLYDQGGVYLDTDVEVLKDFSDICEKGPWFGSEKLGVVASGLGFAVEAGNELIKEIIESYKKQSFIGPDGEYILFTVVDRVSAIFRNYGFSETLDIQDIRGVKVYPPEFFCPKNVDTGELVITDNTYSIHHYDASWIDPWQKKEVLYKQRYLREHGNSKFTKVHILIHHSKSALKNLGFIKGTKYILKKFSLRCCFKSI